LGTLCDCLSQHCQVARIDAIPRVIKVVVAERAAPRFLVHGNAGETALNTFHDLERDLVRARVSRQFQPVNNVQGTLRYTLWTRKWHAHTSALPLS
jgi:hypothetical protein